MKYFFIVFSIVLISHSVSFAGCPQETQIDGSFLVRLKDTNHEVYSTYSSETFVSDLETQGAFVKTIHNQRARRFKSFSQDESRRVPKTLISVTSFSLSAQDLLEHPVVESVEPDCLMSVGAVPNDPRYSDMWGLELTQMEQAWDISTGSADIIVAISDTGIDYNHPDLKDNMWINLAEKNGFPNVDDDGNGCVDDIYGCDTADHDGDPMPSQTDGEHGTHVAGTVGAVGNNAVGVVGINWNVKLMASKGFPNGSGQASLSSLLGSVYYSVDNGARVVNCSWGGPGTPDSASKDAFQYAIDNGVVPVIAAGNNTMDAKNFNPAGISFVLTVGATNSIDQLATFSNYGNIVDVVAPGGDVRRNGMGRNDTILSTFPFNNYAGIQGTSMAAPHIAGLAGLVLSINPNLNVQEVIDLIIDTGDMLDVEAGNSARTNFRYPRMNAYAAALAAQSTLPQPTPTPPADDTPNVCTGELCSQSGAQVKQAELGSSMGCGLQLNNKANHIHPFVWLLLLLQPILLVFRFRK